MTGIDTTAESRAWAAARNVPDDVMTEHEFLHGEPRRATGGLIEGGTVHIDFSGCPIPGFAAHTEAAIARIAGNSIVNLDAREQAMGDLLEALAHLFDDNDHTPFSMRLTAARRAWRAWKESW